VSTPSFIRTECGGLGEAASLENVVQLLLERTYLTAASSTVFKLFAVPLLILNSGVEYRVFVLSGMVTAISQKHMYRVLVSGKEARTATEAIAKTFALIKPNMHVDTYVADVFVHAEGGLPSCAIMGLHDWGCTSPALFCWIKDAELLAGVYAPEIQVRYTTAAVCTEASPGTSCAAEL
jgi:hypothetical protein